MLGREHLFNRLLDRIGDIRRNDFTNRPTNHLIGGHDQQVFFADGPNIDLDTRATDAEHQIGDRVQNGAIVRFAVLQGEFGFFALGNIDKKALIGRFTQIIDLVNGEQHPSRRAVFVNQTAFNVMRSRSMMIRFDLHPIFMGQERGADFITIG